MPIYEYACEKCEREFEVEQRITDAPVKSCPSCKSRKVKRLISKTSFVLKGGGWYSDLYSSGKGKDDKSAEKSDASGDGGDAKADSKGESKDGDKAKGKEESKGKAKKKTKKAVA
ncbi:unnamed protein product [marine sediment metagenome]|uniref:Putative regulatory protein FmdB zinc ribbon domain-containing protein n=1 Tax=marine sediment metagenome TaxID=412755 RepID=X0UM75_9ZZZZ